MLADQLSVSLCFNNKMTLQNFSFLYDWQRVELKKLLDFLLFWGKLGFSEL